MEAIITISEVVDKLDARAKATFKKLFAAWKVKWYHLGVMSSWLAFCDVRSLIDKDPSFSLDPSLKCAKSEALLAIGPKDVPFVVYELTKPGNISACQLCRLKPGRDAQSASN